MFWLTHQRHSAAERVWLVGTWSSNLVQIPLGRFGGDATFDGCLMLGALATLLALP